MCLEFNEESYDNDDDGVHEIGLYQTYTILTPSLGSPSERNVLCYNEVMEELSYIDKDGRWFIVKLFAYSKEGIL